MKHVRTAFLSYSSLKLGEQVLFKHPNDLVHGLVEDVGAFLITEFTKGRPEKAVVGAIIVKSVHAKALSRGTSNCIPRGQPGFVNDSAACALETCDKNGSLQRSGTM